MRAATHRRRPGKLLAHLTTREAARVVGSAPRRIRQAIDGGYLPATRTPSGWLIHQDDLMQWARDSQARRAAARAGRKDKQP